MENGIMPSSQMKGFDGRALDSAERNGMDRFG